MKNIDESFEQFMQFKSEIDSYIDVDLSESDTRSKLIDNLFINVLGWDENDIMREGKVESGFYDYKISVPGLHFVVEAKRQFKEFDLPVNHKKVSLKAIFKENEETITQIRSYAIDSGIQYGIMTNGRQYILSKLINTDNKQWRENQCLLFNGIDDIQNRYLDFYENFSKYGIVNNGGFKYDLPFNTNESKTIISTLVDRDKELIRNKLSAKLIPIIESIFGEIFSDDQEDDLELIKRCFIENNETKKNRDEIERLFADKAPRLSGIIPAVNLENLEEQIKDEIDQDKIAIKNPRPPRPIVIVGSKGAGKTTFIKHLFQYKMAPGDIKDHLVAYIDIRKLYSRNHPISENTLSKIIIECIYNNYPELQLHSLGVLERIYLKNIQRNDESIWLFDKENDPVSYNRRVSLFLEEHEIDFQNHLIYLSKYLIRERRMRLIIIIDNADQFDINIQEHVFLFAHSLALTALCGTVISLREGYFYKWRSSPPFDAYESNVYHVTAPKYSEVLQSRIDFTLEKISLTGSTKGEDDKGYIIEIENVAIIEFLSVVKDSLFSEKNTDLINFLNYTTYPNIREGLRVFKQFLTSGHTNVAEYIMRERFRTEKKDAPLIPMHEFIKSIGLQNQHYYNSEISIIHNIFTPPSDSNDHFLKLYVLERLYEALEKKGIVGRYISNQSIIEEFNSFGYRINTINSGITELLILGLVETDEQLTDINWEKLPENFNLTISSKGHYYLKELHFRFHYLDLVLQDTPIYEKSLFSLIRSHFPLSDDTGKRQLQARIETVNHFIDYLEFQESKQPTQIIHAFGKVIDSIKGRLNPEIERIEKIVLGGKM